MRLVRSAARRVAAGAGASAGAPPGADPARAGSWKPAGAAGAGAVYTAPATTATAAATRPRQGSASSLGQPSLAQPLQQDALDRRVAADAEISDALLVAPLFAGGQPLLQAALVGGDALR